MKNLLLIFMLCFFTSCGVSTPLLDPNQMDSEQEESSQTPPPPVGNKLQVTFDTMENVEFIRNSLYQIHLHQVDFLVGDVRISQTVPEEVSAQHTTVPVGPDPVVPTTCNFQNQFSAFSYVSLVTDTTLPCIEVPKSIYHRLTFVVSPLAMGLSLLGEDLHLGTSFKIRGEATHVYTGRVYSFEISSTERVDIDLRGNWDLTTESTQLKVVFDFSNFFNRVNFIFASVDEDGVYKISPTQNSELYQTWFRPLVSYLQVIQE